MTPRERQLENHANGTCHEPTAVINNAILRCRLAQQKCALTL